MKKCCTSIEIFNFNMLKYKIKFFKLSILIKTTYTIMLIKSWLNNACKLKFTTFIYEFNFFWLTFESLRSNCKI